MNTPSTAAVVCTGPREVDVQRIGLPELGHTDVLVSTLASGVSTGTDRWAMQGRFGWAVLEPPFVPGYQRAGVVEAIGVDVHTVTVGQQVVATNSRDFVGARAAWGAHTGLGVSRAADVYDATGIDPHRAAFLVVAASREAIAYLSPMAYVTSPLVLKMPFTSALRSEFEAKR